MNSILKRKPGGKKKEIELLTSMRGIAALMIAVYHINFQLPNLSKYLSSHFYLFDKSYLWVDFFFILSGFVISYIYKDDITKNIKNYKKFVIARFARIYPLHLFVLIVLFLLELSRFFLSTNHAPFEEDSKSIVSFFSNLLLVHSLGFFDRPTWNTPSWSISAEWYTYLLFPLLVYLLFGAHKLIVYIFLMISIAGLACLITLKGSLSITHDYGFIRCLLGFSMGMIAYRLYEKRSTRLALDSSLLLTLCLVSLLMLMLFLETGYTDLLVILNFFALVLVLVCYSKGIYYKVLGNKVLIFIGIISYSIYMTHTLIIFVFFNLLQYLLEIDNYGENLTIRESLFVLSIYLLVIIGFSFLTYKIIELPFRNRIRERLTNITSSA